MLADQDRLDEIIAGAVMLIVGVIGIVLISRLSCSSIALLPSTTLSAIYAHHICSLMLDCSSFSPFGLLRLPYYCDFFFDAHSFLWIYSQTECSAFIAFYVAFLYCAVLCAAVIFIDTIAFFAIIQNVNKVKKLSKSSLGAPDSVLLNKNIKLYMQGCLQAGCFALVTVSFFVFSRMATTKWALFVTTTLAWELAHAVDGYVCLYLVPWGDTKFSLRLILIAFHERFRVILRQPSMLWRNEFTETKAANIPTNTS
ncbi:hypothetical protein OSTOST_09491, partial [Ostertagia ostertagi]